MRPPLAFLGAACLAGCAVTDSEPADLILHGGDVWTVDASRPTAEAIAVRDGRIVLVGSDAEALALRGADTRVIDVAGAFVLPGFVDNHVHFASAARFLEFNVMRVSTQEVFVERVRKLVAQLPPGDWILGGYWGAYDQWAEGTAGGEGGATFTPDMSLVEDLTARHPMFIRRFDDSEFLVNRAAIIEASGVARSGPWTIEAFEAAAPRAFSHERRVAQTRSALAEAARRGVTTVSDMSDDEQLAIYRELADAGELTLRIHFRYPLDRWNELAERGIRVGSGDEWIRLGGLKGHIDGIMGTSTARFFEPYSHDPGNRGRWRRLMVDEDGNFVEEKFLRYMLDADRAGLQLSVHAIGDEANHLLLDYLAELERRNGPRDRRFRLVHAQVIAPDDFQRLGELGVVAEVQPFHLSDDMRWMEERIGRERCRGADAFKSIVEAGAVLSFGTDWPGTSAAEYPIDPLLGLYAATTRRTLRGAPPGGWFPDERITVEQAIEAYTLASAYANFEEDDKGSLEVGKLADMVILDRNLLKIPAEEIPSAQVLHTIVGGRVVYAR
ncbi:MAG: amidohydrolase [Planctomycetota bacterium]|nr:amidohydrolase [Planctomycetota bacterium]